MNSLASEFPNLDVRGIDRLPSGRFRLRMQIARKTIKGTFATVEHAIRLRDAALRQVADEQMVPVDGVSLAQLGPAFLRSRESNRDHKTERRRWDRHVASAAFAMRPLVTVTRRDVKDWLEELRVKQTAYPNRENGPLKRETRKHCLDLLRRFFAWAQDREVITLNPAVGLEVERHDGDEDDGFQPTWFLDKPEQDRLLDVADPLEKLIIAFDMGTGLRLGELNCLHLEDVRVDDPNPHILVRYGSYDAKNKRYRSPKGKKGTKYERRVPLFGLALDAARAWLAVLPSYAKRNPHGLMFPTRYGARRDKAPRTWKATVERFGVIPRAGRKPWWHLLRHICASSLIAGWWGRRWTLDEVKAFLGHSSVKVTERYAHLAESVVDNIAAEAETAWRKSRHAAVTARKTLDDNTTSARPSKPRVAGSSPAGRASGIIG